MKQLALKYLSVIKGSGPFHICPQINNNNNKRKFMWREMEREELEREGMATVGID